MFVTLRVLATAHLVAVFVQPALAGLYLGGDYDALRLHRLGADAVTVVAFLQLLVVIALAVLGGPRWPLWASAAVIAGESVQYLAGEESQLALHIPLGVSVVIGAVLVFLAVWRAPAGERADEEAEDRSAQGESARDGSVNGGSANGVSAQGGSAKLTAADA